MNLKPMSLNQSNQSSTSNKAATAKKGNCISSSKFKRINY